MKKILVFILLVFASDRINAQFVNTQTISSRTTLYKTLGGFTADSGLIISNNFPDTATANFSVVSKYNTIIRVGNALWFRTLNPNRWNLLLSQISGGFLAVADTASMLSGYKTYFPRTAISAGTGISYNNVSGVITNTAPDQTVTLTAGSGISVSGTYPNFTVTNSSTSSGGTVTSIGTNNSTGIVGGNITTTGVLFLDTVRISTRAWRQKGIDSVSTVFNDSLTAVQGRIQTKLGLSDTTFSSSGVTTRNRTKQQIDSLANILSNGYVPYTGAVASVNLGEFRLSSRSIATDSILARSSAGGRLVSNSGTTIAEYGLGGGSNFDFHGFAGYNANRSASYTPRSFTDKGYVDSIATLKKDISDSLFASGYTRRDRTKQQIDSLGAVSSKNAQSGMTVIDLHYGILKGTALTPTETPGVNSYTVSSGSSKYATSIVLSANSSIENSVALVNKQLIVYKGVSGNYFTCRIASVSGTTINLAQQLEDSVAAGANFYSFYNDQAHPNVYGYYAIADYATTKAKTQYKVDSRVEFDAQLNAGTWTTYTANDDTTTGSSEVTAYYVTSPTANNDGIQKTFTVSTAGAYVARFKVNTLGNLIRARIAYNGRSYDTLFINNQPSTINLPFYVSSTINTVNIFFSATTNGQSFIINKDVPILKTSGIAPDLSTQTQVLLGDSWFDFPHFYDRLTATYPNANIIDKGVGGNTMLNLVNRFNTDVAPFKPKVVWVMTGTNDYYQSFNLTQFSYYTAMMKSMCDSIGAHLVIFNSSVGAPSFDSTRFKLSRQYANNAVYFDENINPIVSGTENYIQKITASGGVGNSQLFDNGTNIGFGTATPTNRLHVIGFYKNPTSDEFTTSLQTRDVLNTGYGGSLGLGGVFNASLDRANFAGLLGGKENATDGNTAGYLGMFVRPNALPIIEAARISSDKSFLIGKTSSSGTALLQNAGNTELDGNLNVEGNVAIGVNTTTKSRVEIRSTNRLTLNLFDSANVAINTTDAFAADRGGSLSLGGTVAGTGLTHGFGGIRASKTNNTSGNVSGYLDLFTSLAGVGSVSHLRILHSGQIIGGVTLPTHDGYTEFQWDGRGKFSDTLTGGTIRRGGGTSTQSLMADGSVQTVTSGSYTPTITAITNVDAGTANVCYYSRVGSMVTVSGYLEVDPTAGSTATEFRITLPIATSFTGGNSGKVAGTMVGLDGAAAGSILADIAGNRASFRYTTPASAANMGLSFTFSYLLE